MIQNASEKDFYYNYYIKKKLKLSNYLLIIYYKINYT